MQLEVQVLHGQLVGLRIEPGPADEENLAPRGPVEVHPDQDAIAELGQLDAVHPDAREALLRDPYPAGFQPEPLAQDGVDFGVPDHDGNVEPEAVAFRGRPDVGKPRGLGFGGSAQEDARTGGEAEVHPQDSAVDARLRGGHCFRIEDDPGVLPRRDGPGQQAPGRHDPGPQVEVGVHQAVEMRPKVRAPILPHLQATPQAGRSGPPVPKSSE